MNTYLIIIGIQWLIMDIIWVSLYPSDKVVNLIEKKWNFKYHVFLNWVLYPQLIALVINMIIFATLIISKS